MWPTGDTGLMPLDIVGLPDYEKLSEPERVLCTELRSPAGWTLCIEPKYTSGCCHLFLHSFEQNLRYDSNKALLADQWYYILYFVSWSASLIQRRRHHRKGACCWQRQGRLWGSMSIRRGASASRAYIFFIYWFTGPKVVFRMIFYF